MIHIGERYCEIFVLLLLLLLLCEMGWDNAQLETLILTKSGKILLGNYFINLCKESMLS
jgi:hypothetical protein